MAPTNLHSEFTQTRARLQRLINAYRGGDDLRHQQRTRESVNRSEVLLWSWNDPLPDQLQQAIDEINAEAERIEAFIATFDLVPYESNEWQAMLAAQEMLRQLTSTLRWERLREKTPGDVRSQLAALRRRDETQLMLHGVDGVVTHTKRLRECCEQIDAALEEAYDALLEERLEHFDRVEELLTLVPSCPWCGAVCNWNDELIADLLVYGWMSFPSCSCPTNWNHLDKWQHSDLVALHKRLTQHQQIDTVTLAAYQRMVVMREVKIGRAVCVRVGVQSPGSLKVLIALDFGGLMTTSSKAPRVVNAWSAH